MKLAVVILNWNGRSLLEQFLPAVMRYTQGADVYVADNASTDTSITFVQQHYPEVKIIRNSSNKGYAGGYNEALQQVHAQVYCLLNSDIEVTPHWLVPVLHLFTTNKKVAVVQPKILSYRQKDHFEYAGAGGGYIDALGYPFCRGRIFNTLEKDTGQYNDTTEIFWASGACFFIRSNVFHAHHGFDEAYFAHQEEIDLCWRIRHSGLAVFYTGASTVYHVGGATLSDTTPKKAYLNFRNSLFSLMKNLPKRVLFPILLLRFFLDGVAALQCIVQGKIRHAYAIVHAHFSGYAQLGKMLKKRNAIRPHRNYYRVRSIVWSYFIGRKKHFRQLP